MGGRCRENKWGDSSQLCSPHPDQTEQFTVPLRRSGGVESPGQRAQLRVTKAPRRGVCPRRGVEMGGGVWAERCL